jgi:hypothetical protein
MLYKQIRENSLGLGVAISAGAALTSVLVAMTLAAAPQPGLEATNECHDPATQGCMVNPLPGQIQGSSLI